MSPQAIKYESTDVPVSRSVKQIEALCKKYGGWQIEVRYVDGEIESIRFLMQTKRGVIPILIRAPSEPVFQVLRKHRPRGQAAKQRKLAKRIAWRHMRDLTEQRLLSAFLQVEDPAEAFMAHIEQEPGVTTGQLMLEQVEARGGFEKVLMIGSGS